MRRCPFIDRTKQAHEIAALAREFSEEAILKLAELMRSKDVPPRTVLAAITELLDRGIGKPVQLTAMPMLEAPRTGDEAKDVSPGRPVIIEQDPLYHSYLAWNKALKQ